MNSSTQDLNSSLTTLKINDTPSSSSTHEPSSSTVESKEKKQDDNPFQSKKKQMIRDLPVHNVPEKIILCLDTCIDPEFTPFKGADDSSFSPLFMLKRITEFFVHNKHFIDPKHEFALLTLEKRNVKWIQDFTNLPREIVRPLNEINYSCEQDEEYDLSVLLDEVWKAVSIPKEEKDLTKPPPYVVRLILLYSRSFSVPVVKRSFKELLENPYFIMDVISTHEEVTEKNMLKEILNNLQIDEKGYSYNFWVGRDARLLHEAMAKLLAHPFQRPIQSSITSYASHVVEKDD